MSFGEYVKKMRKRKGWTLDKLAKLVSEQAKTLADKGEEEYKESKLSKYQLSHIENDSKGREPDKKTINLLIEVLELQSFEIQELQEICQEFGIGNQLPDLLKALQPANQEIARQSGFTDIHIVSDCPLEIVSISKENSFLVDFIREIKSPRNVESKYTYWTVENSIHKFDLLFKFMMSEGVSIDTLKKIQVITCPEEMCMFSCSIYSFTTTDTKGRTNKQVGRFLIREDDKNPNNFNLTNMGSADIRKLHDFLIDVKSLLGTEYQKREYKLYHFDEKNGLEKKYPEEVLK